MCGHLQLTKRWVCVMMLVFAGLTERQLTAAAQPEHQDAARTTGPQPIEPSLISADQREALGLSPPTWTVEHGKLHPAVPQAMARENRDQDDPMAGYRPGRPVGFQGTIYVEVTLRSETQGEPRSEENRAAIRAVQDRVLSRLTAAEFSLKLLFRDLSGMSGYATSAGLDKLMQDPDVVAVALDEKPAPKDPPRATPDPAEEGAQGPVERIGKVEAAVYRALERSTDGYVFVIVNVDSRITPDALSAEKAVIERTTQDRVLSTLTAGEFRLRGRSGSSLDGFVNLAGLHKLDQHADVLNVGLTQSGRALGRIKKP